jgi:hypothetical protein
MTNDELAATKAAWQSQPLDLPVVSIDYLRHRAREHRDDDRTRTIIEYLLCAVAVGMCVWFGVAIDSGLFRAGVVILLAGILFSLYESWRRRLRWSLTLDGPATDGLRFYRQELGRLGDLHRSWWRIYVPASLPGAAMLLTWMFQERVAVNGNGKMIGVAVAVAVWIAVMVRDAMQKAKRFRRELDALEH